MSLVIIVFGTVEAFICGLRMMIAGLNFQLAADIIETSITNGWEAVARLGAIAVIRTFLNYLLERDLAEIRERQHQVPGSRAGEPTGALE